MAGLFGNFDVNAKYHFIVICHITHILSSETKRKSRPIEHVLLWKAESKTLFFANLFYGNHCGCYEKNKTRFMRTNLPEQKRSVPCFARGIALKLCPDQPLLDLFLSKHGIHKTLLLYH